MIITAGATPTTSQWWAKKHYKLSEFIRTQHRNLKVKAGLKLMLLKNDGSGYVEGR